MSLNILLISGGNYQESLNEKLLDYVESKIEELGQTVSRFKVYQNPLPLYCYTDEEKSGLPETAKKVKQMMIDADAVIFASPEYNSSLSPALKNLIDWVSRKEESDSKRLIAYDLKTTGLLSASPGPMGGIRGLFDLRKIVSSIGMLVVPAQAAVYAENNSLDTNDAWKPRVDQVINQVIKVSKSLKNA